MEAVPEGVAEGARWLTVREAASVAGVPERTVRHWCQRGLVGAKRGVLGGGSRRQGWLVDRTTLDGAPYGEAHGVEEGVTRGTATLGGERTSGVAGDDLADLHAALAERRGRLASVYAALRVQVAAVDEEAGQQVVVPTEPHELAMIHDPQTRLVALIGWYDRTCHEAARTLAALLAPAHQQ